LPQINERETIAKGKTPVRRTCFKKLREEGEETGLRRLLLGKNSSQSVKAEKKVQQGKNDQGRHSTSDPPVT